MSPCYFCMDWAEIAILVVNGKFLTLLFHMIWFVNILEETRNLMTSNVMQNILKLQSIKEKLKFATWISVIWYLWLETNILLSGPIWVFLHHLSKNAIDSKLYKSVFRYLRNLLMVYPHFHSRLCGSSTARATAMKFCTNKW